MGKMIDKEDGVIEVSFNDNGIINLIYNLKELNETKQHTHFTIDNANELLIHHKEDEFL